MRIGLKSKLKLRQGEFNLHNIGFWLHWPQRYRSSKLMETVVKWLYSEAQSTDRGV